ncbi:MAG TPA: hypothetical protein PK566_18865 [Pseudobacteroides sp.]|nr:hypothetical protein [Pseudobacteroides sp.]
MDKLEFKTLLEMILKVTQKNASILADSYLLKDNSIISKWKTKRVTPKSYDIDKIIEFTLAESSASQRKILRDRIEALVINSEIEHEIKKLILDKDDFEDFLREALSVSVCDSYSGQDNMYEKEDTESIESKKDDSIKGTVHKMDNRFRGTLEFDIAIPEKSLINSSTTSDFTNLELKGTVNMSPKNKLYRATRYLTKTSVIVVITILALSGVFISSSLKQPSKDNLNVYNSKTSEIQENRPLSESNADGSSGSAELSSTVPAVTPILPTPTQAPEPTQPTNTIKPSEAPASIPETAQGTGTSNTNSNNSNSNNSNSNNSNSSNSNSNNANNNNTNISKTDNYNTNSNNTNNSNINFSGNINIVGNGNDFYQGVDISVIKED